MTARISMRHRRQGDGTARMAVGYGCCLPDQVALCPAERLPLVRALRGEEALHQLLADARAPDRIPPPNLCLRVFQSRPPCSVNTTSSSGCFRRASLAAVRRCSTRAKEDCAEMGVSGNLRPGQR
jgi:hypothetical protein